LADFQEAFARVGGNPPFPWQERLFQELCAGRIPSALDLPTGLGKTSVMAIWHLARAAGAPLPRRLVYVVDRRAVVDQATEVAVALKEHDDTLRVSTLRGQYVDNRAWLEDPAGAAIVVGTVDMVGSRLLFSGYGVSPKMRPYHTGFLGSDTLVVLDEAHLVPPFEALLEAIAGGARVFGPAADAPQGLVPPFRLLSLSATGRLRGGAFRLDKDDLGHPVVMRRLHAEKRLTLSIEVGDGKAFAKRMAEHAWMLATRDGPARVLVFCNSREDALKVKEEIDGDRRTKETKAKPPSQLLVGERRVHEREALFHWLREHGFIDGEGRRPEVPMFLIATSAGEVGVDLDADHMVCDLVEWERMVQRLGRVNRRGGEGRSATVEVIAGPGRNKKDAEPWEARLARLRKPIDALGGDASPAAIMRLRDDADFSEALQRAQTPPPLRPALTRPLVDAWAMTSLEEHTGRPDIEPWLRGWEKDEEPQARIVWRGHLPWRKGADAPVKKDVDTFFGTASVHLDETLEAPVWRIHEWLVARAGASRKRKGDASKRDDDGPAAIVLDRRGKCAGHFRISDLADPRRLKGKDRE
jgi:CRISPR-associated endonuclease/helicase Cas3